MIRIIKSRALLWLNFISLIALGADILVTYVVVANPVLTAAAKFHIFSRQIVPIGVIFASIAGFLSLGITQVDATHYDIYEWLNRRFALSSGLWWTPWLERLYYLTSEDFRPPEKIDVAGKTKPNPFYSPINVIWHTADGDIPASFGFVIKRLRIRSLDDADRNAQILNPPDKNDKIPEKFYQIIRDALQRAAQRAAITLSTEAKTSNKNIENLSVLLTKATTEVNNQLQAMLENPHDSLWCDLEVELLMPRSAATEIERQKERGKAKGEYVAEALKGLKGMPDIVQGLVGAAAIVAPELGQLFGGKKNKGQRQQNTPEDEGGEE